MGWFDRKRHDSGEWTGFLDQGVKLEGRLECPGTFRIDSAMKGTLVSHETLILGEHAKVEGQIDRQLRDHRRPFRRHDKSLRQSRNSNQSHRHGRNPCPCLIMEPGAMFDGRCHMLSATEADETHNHSHPFGRRARITGTRICVGELLALFVRSPRLPSAL